MANASQQWKVLPHGALEQLSPRLMTVTGDLPMPLTTLQRRMTVVRLDGGRLVIFSAIALAEEEMRRLEEFGCPTFLVVPSHLHRQDAGAWKLRYPELTVVAPAGARARVQELVEVDTSEPEFQDDSVRFLTVSGTGALEGALEIRTGGRVSLVLNDLVGNLPKTSGLVLRGLGFAGDRPRIPRAVKHALVKDANALRRQFEDWAGQAAERIIVSHGEPIAEDVPQVLRDLASSL